MHLLDWIIILVSLSVVLGFGIYTQQYMKSVADFLSAGRVARRYLLATGKAEMGAGAVIYVALFEMISQGGFPPGWWGAIAAPIGLAIGIVGFVVYRYRETRAMTLGQFYEIRYGRKFRLFMGYLGFFSGLLNFGIMPLVGAHMMVYFLGLPVEFHLHGTTIQTFIPLMGLFLSINLLIGTSGGILTVIMTNFAEGLVSQILYVLLIVGLIYMFSWAQITSTMTDHPAGLSLMNPMDAEKISSFNLRWVIMSVCLGIYFTMAWQNQSGYNSAPLNAHEARMTGLLARWRGMGTQTVVVLLGICGMTYLHDPSFAAGAAQVHAMVSQISDPHTQKQMLIPIAVIHLLPIGLKGALCTALLLGIFGGDSSHLHSWSSVMIQDVVLPLRKKPLTPEQHIRLLRLAMAGVALFAFLFGVFVNPQDYIIMWWNVTSSIYVAGAGVAIIGGLYWKKGTNAGAWAGTVVGSVLSITGIIARQLYGDQFPDGTIVSFFAMLIAIVVYMVVSLRTCREAFNMDRMLHRGVYAHIKEEVGEQILQPENRKITWGKIIGYDENFTLADKWVAGGLFVWTMLLSLISIFGTLWNLIWPWPIWLWSEYWHVTAVLIPGTIALITTVWFTWGGINDVIDLFRRLEQAKNNPLDNGAVVNHQNLDESVLPDAVSPLLSEPESEPPVVMKP